MPGGDGNDAGERRARAIAMAAWIVRARDIRAEAFAATGPAFADPAWDLLLDIYLATARGAPLSVGAACIGSRVPPTTALRWIGALITRSLIVRTGDGSDRRRALLSMSADQLARFEAMLLAIEAASGSTSEKRSSSRPSGR